MSKYSVNQAQYRRQLYLFTIVKIDYIFVRTYYIHFCLYMYVSFVVHNL